MRIRTLAALAAATTVTVLGATAPAHAAGTQVSARFVVGSSTDGLRHVTGTETFTDANAGTLTVTGQVQGLAPNTSYVTVPYTDPYCTPIPGVTAYPSSSFTTDGLGKATFTASVNPKAINPTGTLAAGQVNSVSIRQVIVSSPLPGFPNVPNVGAVETCDRHPVHS